MEIQRVQKCDTVEAFKRLGLKKADFRNYRTEVEVLDRLEISKKIILYSGNPNKIKALEKAGYEIIKFLEVKDKKMSKEALAEKRTKRLKMGYKYLHN